MGWDPENNWLAWQDHRSTGKERPDPVFEALSELIKGEWRDNVCKYADDDPTYLDSIHPKLREAVAEVLGEGRSFE